MLLPTPSNWPSDHASCAGVVISLGVPAPIGLRPFPLRLDVPRPYAECQSRPLSQATRQRKFPVAPGSPMTTSYGGGNAEMTRYSQSLLQPDHGAPLPMYAYSVLPRTGQVILVKCGECGYWAVDGDDLRGCRRPKCGAGRQPRHARMHGGWVYVRLGRASRDKALAVHDRKVSHGVIGLLRVKRIGASQARTAIHPQG